MEKDQKFTDFWPGFAIDSYNSNNYPTPSDSVAYVTLEACGIEHQLNNSDGGKLVGVDIKNLDATSALKMSLMESYAKGGSFLLEPVVNSYGAVELVRVGSTSGNITDIYHRIRTSNYISYENVVKITGQKPRPIRRVGNYLTLTDSEEYDALIWDTSYMATGCQLKNIKKHATITFKDPHKEYTDSSDNIASIYEAEWPWERVIGWLYYLDPGIYDNSIHPDISVDTIKKDLKVFLKSQSSVPILIAGPTETTGRPNPNITEENYVNIGTLKRREYNPLMQLEPECFEGLTTEAKCSDYTINVNIPENIRFENIRGIRTDKFLGVSRIYVVGQELQICRPYARSSAYVDDEAAQDKSNWDLWIAMNAMEPRYINLDEGTDYAVSYEPENEERICVQFVDNSMFEDIIEYTSPVNYRVFPNCEFYNYNDPDGAFSSPNTAGTGTILPRYNKTGILAQQVWAQVDLDIPSLVVIDPYGSADEVAKGVILQMAPIIMKEEPAPIAIDGELLDLTEVFRSTDADPTTIQDFENTRYEQLISSMNGKQVIELNMSTLDETETQELSSRLKDIMESDRSKDINISYVCGPACNPQIGGLGNAGGIVNSVSYNYSDGGSYTITVNEGPYIVSGSLSGITGDYYNKATESLQKVEGRVIQDYGNNIIYKVLVDGIGIVEAILGTAAQIVKEGDKVSVTIHNVPVEA